MLCGCVRHLAPSAEARARTRRRSRHCSPSVATPGVDEVGKLQYGFLSKQEAPQWTQP